MMPRTTNLAASMIPFTSARSALKIALTAFLMALKTSEIAPLTLSHQLRGLFSASRFFSSSLSFSLDTLLLCFCFGVC